MKGFTEYMTLCQNKSLFSCSRWNSWISNTTCSCKCITYLFHSHRHFHSRRHFLLWTSSNSVFLETDHLADCQKLLFAFGLPYSFVSLVTTNNFARYCCCKSTPNLRQPSTTSDRQSRSQSPRYPERNGTRTLGTRSEDREECEKGNKGGRVKIQMKYALKFSR